MSTVREFVTKAYRLINPSNPTTPLHGDDLSTGISTINQLLRAYSATGLLLPIAYTESVVISIGQQEVVCGASTAVPTPDITRGRLANLDSAWLLLNGVTYPLIDESRNEFFAAWKYDPLQSLPRFIIVLPDTNVTRLRIYPAPSQPYELFIRGKFQLDSLTANDEMATTIPEYALRHLSFASAKDIAMYGGRSEAWTDKLEAMLQEARDEVEAASETNLAITGDGDSMLNGAWRIRAGV